MALAPGSRLGPYEVLSPIGAGGMGEVYRARDDRLGRTVAIKVLSSRRSASPEARERFLREARTVSQLSHPHICALHDVGREGDTDFLVMEYLEGETLADRLEKGPLPAGLVLSLGAEIAAALDHAHRHGLVHRDVKPGNVMLTKSGVKLLDFGLARALAPAGSAIGLTDLSTADRPLTGDGAVLGTLPYMAPEQLEGKATDARTDVFALGAVLYEMATGRRPFPSASQTSLISAILRDDPPAISSVRPESPPALDRVVGACLAKDPDDRWQSAADLARELRWIADGPTSGGQAPAAAPRKRRELLAWGVAATAILAAALAALLPRHAPPRPGPLRFKILAPPGQSFFPIALLSPDASRLLVLLRDDGGKNVLAVRPLDSLEVRLLPGTGDARGGFWSPDGREVAFFAEGKLKRMSSDGGPAQTLCESGAAVWGAWSREGTILFEKEFGGPLFAVPAAGGAPRQLYAPGAAGEDVHQNQPCFLPDGRHFVFLASNADFTRKRIVLGSLDSSEVRPLFPSDSSAVYAEPGYLLFARDDAVLAWRFDPHGLRLVGEPVPAFSGVHWERADNYLSLSAAGNRVAYGSWALRRRLAWVDRKGRELGSLGEVGGYTDVRISPDGRRVAVALRDPSHNHNEDIWVLDVSRGTAVRVTASPMDDFNPAWFPDGDRIAYVSDHFGFYNLFERPAGGGPEKVLVRSEEDKTVPTVLADGRHILVGVQASGVFSREIVDVADPRRPLRLGTGSGFSEEHPSISADGRWSAFDSIESGQREVYLQPVPDGPRRQVSIGGGQMPVWRRDGRELFYAARDGTLMSVALGPQGGGLELGEPQPLFPLQLDLSGELPWTRLPYDVTPDGQRFLVIRRARGVEPDGVVVVTDWTGALAGGR